MQRVPKTNFTFPAGGSNLAQKMFPSFFIQEVNIRDTEGRAFNPGKGAAQRYEKLLKRMAENIWQESLKLNVNAVNLSFIFLNKYYPMFIGHSTPVPKMQFFWDDFLIYLSHDRILLSLLNYDEKRRKLICAIIKEIQETKKSKKFNDFLKDKINNFKVKFPEHIYERSLMFETILVAVKQIEDQQLDYFIKHHAIEMVKAHIWALKKYGDPIKLSLGCFKGDIAMYRLKNYQTWEKKGSSIAVQPYTYSDRHKPDTAEFLF